ncbi:MAG: flippase-like domain-containing protein [Desulfobacteraceae bacterium]|nr:flippase-like domain-containing protein [Desulfobacteraceae bacterium]
MSSEFGSVGFQIRQKAQVMYDYICLAGMKNFLRIVSAIAVIIISIIYLYMNRFQLAVLKNIYPTDMVVIFILTFLFFCVTGYTFSMLVGLMGVKLSSSEIVGLSILTNFGNYLGPIRPGAALKAVYLKASRGLAYTRFTSVLAANTFLAFFVTGGVGMILLFLLKKENTDPPYILFFACIGIIIGSVLPFFYKIPDIRKKNRFTDLLRATLEGFKIIRVQKSRLALICLSFLVQFFLAALLNQVVYRSVGVPISFLSALVIGVFTSIANFFTITPNNLGVQEAVSAYLFTLAGYDYTTGVIGAGLGRMVHMAITFSLAPIFSHYLLKSLNLSLMGRDKSA